MDAATDAGLVPMRVSKAVALGDGDDLSAFMVLDELEGDRHLVIGVALAAVTNSLPSGCPVIIRSLSPAARRILDLLDLGLRQGLSAGPEHHDTPVRREGSRLTPAE